MDSQNNFGSSFDSSMGSAFGTAFKPQQTPSAELQALLMLAESRGGRISDVAKELGGKGRRNILTQVKNTAGAAFGGLMDILSTPGEVVAGMLDPNMTIKEAIDNDAKVSDVLFGSTNLFNPDGTPTTMQRSGNGVVRFAVDVLTDPLTYLTFGASAGVAGTKALTKVSVAGNLAKQSTRFAIKEGDTVTRTVSQLGQDVLDYQNMKMRQVTGRQSIDNIEEFGKQISQRKKQLINKGVNKDFLKQLDITTKKIDSETRQLLKETIEAPLDENFAKEALGKLLSANPTFAGELLDRGGIKFVGKTVLSAQRINSVMDAIPGISYFDNMVMPVRNRVNALFNPMSVTKVDGNWTSVPPMVRELVTKFRNTMNVGEADIAQRMTAVQKELDLSMDEWRLVADAASLRLPPVDPKHAKAYFTLLDLDKAALDATGKIRGYSGVMDNHVVSNWFMPTDTRGIRGNSAFAAEAGTQKTAQNVKFIAQTGETASTKSVKFKQYIDKLPDGDKFKTTLTSKKSNQEIITELGNKANDLRLSILQRGGSIDDVVNNKQFKELVDIQNEVYSITDLQSTQKIGKADELGIAVKKTDEEIKKIIDETERTLEKLSVKKEVFEKDIIELADKIQQAFSGGVTKNFDNILANLPSESRDNAKVILKKIEDYVGRADLEKLKNAVKKNDEVFNSIEDAAKGIKDLDYDEKVKMVKAVLKDEEMISLDIEELNKYIKEVLDKKSSIKKSKTEKVVKEVISESDRNAVAKLYEESRAAKFAKAGKDIDENTLTKLVEVLKEEYITNPVGSRSFIKSLIGREEKLSEVISLMDETKAGMRKKISEIPEDAFMFTDGEVMYKRVAASMKELQDAGFTNYDTNVLTAATARLNHIMKQNVGAELIRDTVRNMGKFASEAPDTWREIDIALVDDYAKQFANIKGRGGEAIKFHPAVAKSIEDMLSASKMDDGTKGFLAAVDKLNGFFRAAVTTIFPMFHGRNAISNVYLSAMDIGLEALNPVTHTMAGTIQSNYMKLFGSMAKDVVGSKSIFQRMQGAGDNAVKAAQEYNQIMQQKMFKDSTGYEWSFGQLMNVLQKNDVALTKNITGAIDIVNDRNTLSNLFFKSNTQKIKEAVNVLNVDTFAPFKAGRGFGSILENHQRLVHFITNLKMTGDVTQAAKRTKMFLLDYSSLTDFERNVMKRLIPFYTFTRKNLEIQARAVATRPGLVNAEIESVKTIGSIIGGEDSELTEEEKKALPKWLRNKITVKVGTNPDGSSKILTGFGLPIEQPFEFATGEGMLSALSPLVKIPFETVTGQNIFRGMPISEVTNAEDFQDAPEFIKEFIGYTKHQVTTKEGKKYDMHVALRPYNLNALMYVPGVGRSITTLANINDSDTEDGLKALQTITGINIRDVNTEVELMRQDREMLEDVERILRQAGVTGEFQRTYQRKNTKIIEN